MLPISKQLFAGCDKRQRAEPERTFKIFVPAKIIIQIARLSGKAIVKGILSIKNTKFIQNENSN